MQKPYDVYSPAPRRTEFGPDVWAFQGPGCQQHHKLMSLLYKRKDVFFKVGAHIDLGLVEKRCGTAVADLARDLLCNPRVRTAVADEHEPILNRIVQDALQLCAKSLLPAYQVDYLASDHAPHTLEEKSRGISGQPHLDTYGAFVTWLLLEGGLTPERIAAVCSANPGEFVNPYTAPRKFGRIEPGYVASLTVLNLARPVTVRREDLKTKCGWSPFEGVTFPGSVEAVFIEGKRQK